MKETNERSTNTREIEAISEEEYAQKMKRLDEKWLICAALKYCFIPCFAFTLISTYFPYP